MAKRKNLALRKNKSEVIAMSIFEYDKEEEERKLREAEYEAGREEGIKDTKEQIVKKLINMNLSVQQIAKAVQLSENEVEKILNTK